MFKLLLFGPVKDGYVEGMTYMYSKFNELKSGNLDLSKENFLIKYKEEFKSGHNKFGKQKHEEDSRNAFKKWNTCRENAKSYIEIIKYLQENDSEFDKNRKFAAKADRYTEIVEPLNTALSELFQKSTTY